MVALKQNKKCKKSFFRINKEIIKTVSFVNAN
jgi:hypothetical protein